MNKFYYTGALLCLCLLGCSGNGLFEVKEKNTPKSGITIEDREGNNQHPTVPSPQISKILPATLYKHERNQLWLYGRGFLPSSKVFLGKKELKAQQVTFRDRGTLELTIDLTVDSELWTKKGVLLYVENNGKKRSKEVFVSIASLQPVITKVSPSSWPENCATTIVIEGKNFRKSSTVLFGESIFSPNKKHQQLTIHSSSKLSFQVKKEDIPHESTIEISVKNGPTGQSKPYSFQVKPRKVGFTPKIFSIEPSFSRIGKQTKVRVVLEKSSKLPANAIVFLNGVPQKTVCQKKKGVCQGMIFHANLKQERLFPGFHKITVGTQCNKPSRSVPFYLSPDTPPVIEGISPPYVEEGSKHKIQIKGTGFLRSNKLFWDGKELPINVLSPSLIETSQPIDFSQQKSRDISVFLVASKQQQSNKVRFSVTKKKPTLVLTSISPRKVKPNMPHHHIGLEGHGFTSRTIIEMDGKTLRSIFLEPTYMLIETLDLTGKQSRIHHIKAVNGQESSNVVWLSSYLGKNPVLDQIYPSRLTANSIVSLTLSGKLFCQKNPHGHCRGKPTVLLRDQQGNDLSTHFQQKEVQESQKTNTQRLLGTLDTTALSAGTYFMLVQHSSGEKSNLGTLHILPE